MPIYKLGQRVRAVKRIYEEPQPVCPDGHVHAEAGDEGTVEYVEPKSGLMRGTPTVRFDRTGTSTIVFDHEVEILG